MRSPFSSRQVLAGYLSLGLSVALTVAIFYGISRSFEGVYPRPRHLEGDLLAYNPEPVERIQFLTGLLSMPVLLLLSYALFRRWFESFNESTVLAIGRRVGGVSAAALFGLLAAGLILDRGFVWGAAASIGASWIIPGSVTVALALVLALCLGLIRAARAPLLERMNRAADGALRLFAFGLLLLMGLFCVIRLRDVALSHAFFFSFSGLFYPVVQVFQGRELLVDLPTQYGLYPHLIEPFFKLAGLSILSFSLLMSLLNLAAFLCLHRSLRAMLSNGVLAGLAMVAILYNCYFLGRSGTFDLFFQYHPIRMIFPALSILLAWRFFARGERKLYYPAFILAAVAVLWNADTGLVVWLSWVMALVFNELTTRTFRNIPRHLLLGAGSLAGTVGAFSLYLFIRYGQFPNYAEFLRYQQLYYLSGYGMQPMTAIHPWNMVMLVYAAGMLYAVMHLVEGRGGAQASSFFFISVLGCGIFSYYQGRSFDGNLLMVAYPAIILAALFADRLLERYREDGNFGGALLIGIFLVGGAFSLVGMTRTLPVFAGELRKRYDPATWRAETPVTKAVAFIKERTQPGEEVLILSDLSAVYHLESGTLSPRGLADESLEGADALDKIWPHLARSRKFFLTLDSQEMLGSRDRILAHYRPAAWTPDVYMYFFRPPQ